jgi:RNA polymerase sigma-70 factor (ECF subfamily)
VGKVRCDVTIRTCGKHVRTVLAEDEEVWMGNSRRERFAEFEQIYERFRKRVHRIALRITRNAQDAEDVVQESFLLAFLHLESFSWKSAFSTWITRIAINAALMKIRKRRRYEVSFDEMQERSRAGLCPEIASDHPSPDQQLFQRELEQILAEGLRQLTPRLCKIVDLYYFQEVPARECAQRLGISLPNVKSRVLRARRKLRPVFERRFRQQTAGVGLGCVENPLFPASGAVGKLS